MESKEGRSRTAKVHKVSIGKNLSVELYGPMDVHGMPTNSGFTIDIIIGRYCLTWNFMFRLFVWKWRTED